MVKSLVERVEQRVKSLEESLERVEQRVKSLERVESLERVGDEEAYK